MVDLIQSVNYRIKIYFDNNKSITLQSEHGTNESYIESIDVDETLNISNNNPVGVVSANTSKLTINSVDNKLIPDNKNSEFYGYMNSTAYYDIVLIESGEEIPFGRYYVTYWENNATSDKPYQVVIEATDLLGIINKNTVPPTELRKNMNTSDVLNNILAKLNTELSDRYKVNYNKSKWTFGTFNTLEYNNIEADIMSTWFNILSQSTLTNIYYTRDRMLETDYCLDDKKSESVSNLHGDKNVTSVSIDKGGLVPYSGIKVNYILNTINNNTQLIQLTDQALTPGENKFENVDLGNKVYKITAINISTNQKDECTIEKIEYNKRTVSFVVNNKSRNNANVTITLWGQTLKEDVLSIVKHKNNTNTSNEILEITNRLLPKNSIDKFASELLKLLNIKDSSISVSGYFNPRIQLGNQVNVNIARLNIKDYYKVIGLSWRIQGSIKCTAKLLKTIT